MNAVAPTNVGNTSGSGASAAHSRRPGRSRRTVAQARQVPTIIAATDTVAASTRELRRGPQVRATARMSSTSERSRTFS